MKNQNNIINFGSSLHTIFLKKAFKENLYIIYLNTTIKISNFQLIHCRMIFIYVMIRKLLILSLKIKYIFLPNKAIKLILFS